MSICKIKPKKQGKSYQILYMFNLTLARKSLEVYEYCKITSSICPTPQCEALLVLKVHYSLLSILFFSLPSFSLTFVFPTRMHDCLCHYCNSSFLPRNWQTEGRNRHILTRQTMYLHYFFLKYVQMCLLIFVCHPFKISFL